MTGRFPAPFPRSWLRAPAHHTLRPQAAAAATAVRAIDVVSTAAAELRCSPHTWLDRSPNPAGAALWRAEMATALFARQDMHGHARTEYTSQDIHYVRVHRNR